MCTFAADADTIDSIAVWFQCYHTGYLYLELGFKRKKLVHAGSQVTCEILI